MNESDQYIQTLLKKLETVQDKELIILVKKLIEERIYLDKIANIDPLTGLNNRRILDKIRDSSAVVMCDVDFFKGINDTYGHDFGDEVLKKIATIIKQNIRSSDYVCRFGGDEFFISFTNCDEKIVIERLEQIRSLVTQSIVFPDNHQGMTMSFGYVINKGKEKVDSLMQKADKALYYSKSKGKDRISSFDTINDIKLG